MSKLKISYKLVNEERVDGLIIDKNNIEYHSHSIILCLDGNNIAIPCTLREYYSEEIISFMKVKTINGNPIIEFREENIGGSITNVAVIRDNPKGFISVNLNTYKIEEKNVYSEDIFNDFVEYFGYKKAYSKLKAIGFKI